MDEQIGHSWEAEYKRSWDVLQEDENGKLQKLVGPIKRRKQVDAVAVRRGMIRHLFLIIDLSLSMNDLDLRPSRLLCTLSLAVVFITEYMDQNPLSQIGLIVTRDGMAEKLTELSSYPQDHIDALLAKANREARGEVSLQNALELAANSLSHIPKHASREILLIVGSLTSCDPTDIMDTVQTLSNGRIKASVISLAAEIQVCKLITKATNGSFQVVLNEVHFKELILEHIIPPSIPASLVVKSNMILMGFPSTVESTLRLCSWYNIELPGVILSHQRVVAKGYECPRCASVVCTLPSDCTVCGLVLVSALLLARSSHHLFPVSSFQEVSLLDIDLDSSECFSCESPFNTCSAIPHGETSGRFKCTLCTEQFCIDCDILIHETIHNCPGCLSKQVEVM